MKTIALFFGGLSNEAEVSIMSAKNVVKNFDYRRYKLILVYWRKQDSRFYIVKNINKLALGRKRLAIEDFRRTFDIALPMTHGRFGEDVVLQAIFESQKIKYCGCRVLGSAVCMDKAVFKDLMKSAAIPQVKYAVLDFKASSSEEIKKEKRRVKKFFPLPWYIKPANSGSSVGITKVERAAQLDKAIKDALKHDSKIVIEEGLVNPKEIEMAVLGNEELLISRPGELKLAKDFYNYDDKYKLGEAVATVPAKIKAQQAKKIKQLAGEIYQLANCQGFARVDFFIARNKVYLNEINTLPGFTNISMYPMLMMDRGMSYRELLNRIIELAY